MPRRKKDESPGALATCLAVLQTLSPQARCAVIAAIQAFFSKSDEQQIKGDQQ